MTEINLSNPSFVFRLYFLRMFQKRIRKNIKCPLFLLHDGKGTEWYGMARNGTARCRRQQNIRFTKVKSNDLLIVPDDYDLYILPGNSCDPVWLYPHSSSSDTSSVIRFKWSRVSHQHYRKVH